MADLWTPDDARRRHPLLAFFARRPITVAVLLVTTALLGLISVNLMPMELFPSGLEPKSLSVDVPYNRTGGPTSPSIVEREITLIVEGELSTIPGILELGATSQSDEADFDIEFDRDKDMDEAYAEVWAAVERARTRLPDTIGRIEVRRWRGDSNAWPVASVNFSWEDDTVDAHLKLERIIQPHLEAIDGVASVTFEGTFRKFIAVDLDPDKTRAYGVNMAELLQRLRGDNFRAPAGKVSVEEGVGKAGTQRREVYLVADSRFYGVDEIENIPVRPGLTLADITRHGIADGRPHRGVYETYSASRYVRVDRRRGATAMIHKTGEANTVAVGDRIEQALEELRARPDLEGFKITVPRNQSQSIKDSIAALMETLLWGGLLAFAVMLLFLKSWRLSLMIALSIPLSMTMALAVMFFMHETINLLVLMGFTLAGGMLLDNSIVVAENVFRRHSLGEQPYAAAVRGAGEVGLALILATSTTVIVFITVAFMLESEMLSFVMGKIGLPVCLSIMFSILLAIGVIPMTMNSIGLLKKDKTSRFRAWFSRRRRVLRAMLRRGGPIRATAGAAGIALWEVVALAVGRNEHGMPSTPIMDRAARLYERAVARLIAPRYLVAGLMLALTAGGIWMLQSTQQRTDENQGNRDSIWLRAGFDDGSDIMISRNALQITTIESGSAAERAGLKVGDFILRYNSRLIESLEDLRRLEQSTATGALVPVDVARGTQQGVVEMVAGRAGIDGLMQDTQPLRDAIWVSFVIDVENILLGREDAEYKRKAAIEGGMPPEQAQARFGRTPQEAKEYFGIDSLSISFSQGWSSYYIYLDRERVDQAAEFYKRIIAAIPERAGVRMRGQFQGGGSSNSEVSVRLTGPDTERLLKLAEEVEVRLSSIEGLEGLRVDTDEAMDEVTVAVDRQRAAAYGIEPNVLSQVIGFQLSGTALRDYQRGENLLPLRVRFAAPADSAGNPRDPGLQDVAETRINTSSGSAVAAKAITETSGLAKSGTGEIRRRNRQTTLRVVGTTSSDDLERIQSQVRASMDGVRFPPGYSQAMGGRFEGFQQQFSDLYKSLVWAGVLVFLVMCFLFESVLKPACIIVASLPGAMLGGFGLLQITDTPVDSITMLGLLVLVGVVVNNGIVLVDLINRLRAEGMPRDEAVRTAARQRLRPILLTSLTTVFGLIPMAIGDAQFVGMPYYPMGRMVLGGIMMSMLYTLLLVPLLYTILDDIGLAFRHWTAVIFGERARGGGEATAPAPASAE
jgi:multidrug efflux pump subunit AcrB